jgi:nonsense-mediated mRNA decay protein 3
LEHHVEFVSLTWLYSIPIDTYSVEIVPICKDDLIVLPLKVAKQLGNINPLVLCTRVSGGGLTVFDVRTLQQEELQTTVFWRAPFGSLCEAGAGGVGGGLSEYYVLDVEPIPNGARGRVYTKI